MDQYPQQPQSPQQPPQPEPQPQYQVQPTPPTPGRKKMSGRTKAALWLMIGPTALLIVAFTVYVIINATLGSTPDVTTTTSSGDGLFTEVSNPGEQAINIANILLFLVGAVVTLTWLPGLIIGIVLLTTKKH